MHQVLRNALLVAAVVLVVLASVIALFSGPIPALLAAPLATIVAPLPESLVGLLLIAVLVGGAVVAVRGRQSTDRRATSIVGTRQPPEQPKNAPAVVGTAFDDGVETARQEIRLQETPFAETSPSETLRATVVDAIVIAEGCSPSTARDRVAAGEWTDDPIAAGFLGDAVDYPLRFQLVVWARPSDAYARAIERTSHAVDRFIDTELPGVDGAPPEQRPGTPRHAPEGAAP